MSYFCPFWMYVGLKEEMDRRVQKFRTDYADLRNQFDILKKEADAQVCLIAPHSWSCFLFLNLTVSQQAFAQRSELLSTTAIPLSPNNSSARQRFSQFPSSSSTPEHSESPFRTPTPQPNPNAYPPNQNAYASMSREDHALHEHTFIQSTEARLDDFLAQGREVLDNLVDQRNMLKGTQRMLLDSANTLGLSRDVIGWIERRR